MLQNKIGYETSDIGWPDRRINFMHEQTEKYRIPTIQFSTTLHYKNAVVKIKVSLLKSMFHREAKKKNQPRVKHHKQMHHP